MTGGLFGLVLAAAAGFLVGGALTDWLNHRAWDRRVRERQARDDAALQAAMEKLRAQAAKLDGLVQQWHEQEARHGNA